MTRLYLIIALVVALLASVFVAVHQHDSRIRAEALAHAAEAHADTVDAQLVPLERALADTISRLHQMASRDSGATAAAIAHWRTVTQAARVVVRVDTLPGRVDTVFAEMPPKPPDVIAAGNAMAQSCSELLLSCAARAAALERDTAVKSQRIAALEAARQATAGVSPATPTRRWSLGMTVGYGAVAERDTARAWRVHAGPSVTAGLSWRVF